MCGRVFNKTSGFAYSFASFQKVGSQAENAPFLSAKQRTPFRLHPTPILGKIKTRTPIFVLRGSHSHEMELLFRMTISSTIIVQKQRKPTDEPQRKNAEVRSTDLPVLGLVIGRADFRFSYLILKSLKISFPSSSLMVVLSSIAKSNGISMLWLSTLAFSISMYELSGTKRLS